jgi:hypothetical protein
MMQKSQNIFSNIDYDVHYHLAKSQTKFQLVYGEKKLC